MPQPGREQVHIDSVLTNMSVAYVQRSAYVAAQMFPIVPVDKKSDIYYKYTKNDWFRDEAQRRAPSTESQGSGYGLSTDSYVCDTWAFHKDIDDDTRANYDRPLDPDREATEFVTSRMLLRREREWFSTFFKKGVWATDWDGGATVGAGIEYVQWSDYVNSDPLLDVQAGATAIQGITGLKPNTLLMGKLVFNQLKQHPDIRTRYQYTTADNVTVDMLARLFEVDRLIVSEAIYATNNEGATEAYDWIAGKAALLCYSAPAAGLLTASAGYTFSWRGVSDGMGETIGTRKFRMDLIKSDRIESEMAFDMKVVAPDCGFFFATAVA